jgi:AraC family transcriptional regulator, regulatory protein of adaptative response / DNA-3-methyladenine glycosylase II
MHLDPAACYQAVLSRDARFDGRFFTAVRTTGIYCRPICPAPTPKAANVQFFPCAAAAEAAGFRPCRRCRPDTSPGTPAWLGSPAIVSRGLRLILNGSLDEQGVDDLAARLGVGARYLRRLFVAHLGASPRAIAGTRRIHFARTLIDETDLAMTEIALAAGFADRKSVV